MANLNTLIKAVENMVSIKAAVVGTLTDSTGFDGTHNDTLAAPSVPADITGGQDPTEA